MIILPAIDLLQGKCVRLRQGREDSAHVYSDAPAAQALLWQQQGSAMLHLVNLDGAFGRAGKNIQIIKNILSTITIPVELGGGIRSLEDASQWLDLGVTRVIFGTVAVTNPDIIKEAVHTFGAEKVVVGIDARDNKVAIAGWEQQTDTDVYTFARHMKDLGVIRIIYTDVHRDGELSGPNIDNTVALANHTQMQVIASGGFSRLEDFSALLNTNCKYIDGAIVGKALYENQLDLVKLNELYNG
ncbi:MAG TPA: 1-(5-phosphoribosyl)-5-[(5-phosphoribosylamino)methylideneamino]imidazole-4-carboxamide isomerase [bacterium]|nr:1-(5-phosphoribosyl)-5-[(5-phosphoribosylamino)methylideneamino]imidazole-4-carboxamide isomerase [bacterium]HPN45350.1 1-(5-phosphoribosyl)-5-[(5-phosphoribosylamino)methylideneamino]imidazole-4-carboxamide isomerase [bacterium]